MKQSLASIFVITQFFFTSLSQAQNSKCDPNNCTIKSSGKYKVELAGCNNYLDIYVLDASEKPLKNIDIHGFVEFFYLDETTLISPFRQFFKTNSLRARIPIQGFYNCKITLKIENEVIEIYFDNECGFSS